MANSTEYRKRGTAAFPAAKVPAHGLARVLSKMGICSRSQAELLVRDGRVTVDGRLVLSPEYPVRMGLQTIAVDGERSQHANKVYMMFNKPRGLVVSASDEQGRSTVYDALASAGLPWLGPVGRLDKASEGLLLLTNDTTWAAGITEPSTHVEKTYHVQVSGQPDSNIVASMLVGVKDGGEMLKARSAALLRAGQKNAWLEIVLDEGRNRHIRRMLAAMGFNVLRLLRVAIGPVVLGELPKGQWRKLDPSEIQSLETRR